MPSQRDANITCYMQPTGEASSKKIGKTEGVKPSDAGDLDESATLNTLNAPKRKRSLSTSPSASTSKRLDTNASTSSFQTGEKHLAYNDLSPEWFGKLSTATEGSKDASSKALQFTYRTGDMFKDAPDNCLLIHACNTQGHWGAGIAKAFKEYYPKAYTAHRKFCAKDHTNSNPVPIGSAQLLAPVDVDSQHWIGCLFTSAKYGKAKDKPDVIVRNTITSMQILLELVKVAGDDIGEIRMCKINSGKFGVPWEKTEQALRSIAIQDGWRDKIEIWEP